MTNPFASWAFQGQSSRGGPPPSVYGALPAVSQAQTSDFLPFYFTSLNGGILNCTLVGPNTQPHLYVITDSSLPGYTVFKTTDGRSVALVEWKQHPQVEIRGSVHKQLASEFIRLSSDRRYRIMTVSGQEYAWVPQDNTICLFKTGGSQATLMAKLSKEQGSIRLEVSPNTVHIGLLQPCVVAVALLQSGQRID